MAIFGNRKRNIQVKNFRLTSGSQVQTVIRDQWFTTGNAYSLVAQTGHYTLGGKSAGLLKNKLLVASKGSYVYNGKDSILLKSRLLIPDTGHYVYNGYSSSGFKAKVLIAQTGHYSWGGKDAVLNKNKLLIASKGSYTISGKAANVYKNKVLVASTGHYAYNGKTANLIYTPGGGGGPVWPLPAQVLLGVTYGPTGADYLGTLSPTGSLSKLLIDIDTGKTYYSVSNKLILGLD